MIEAEQTTLDLIHTGSHRVLTYSSWVLSALSALAALIPFWYIWHILKEVMRVYPDFERDGIYARMVKLQTESQNWTLA